jgi:hypothetical protein
MESLKTALRLVVMLAVVGIGYKAWQHYGPPAAQVKALALRALEVARTALESDGPGDGGNTALTADPRPIAPALDATAPVPMPAGQTGAVMQAQALVPSHDLPAMTPITPPALVPPPTRLPEPDPRPAAAAEVGSKSVSNGDDARIKPLYARLEQLGAHDLQLVQWGASGKMYRFSCKASPAGVESFNRHFDAVANEPQAAIEAVIAKVESWRSAQAGTTQVGTALR